MHTLRPGIWRETLKKVENEKHTIGPGILREILKSRKKKYKHQELKHGEKTAKRDNDKCTL